jgi:hypothetical protein
MQKSGSQKKQMEALVEEHLILAPDEITKLESYGVTRQRVFNARQVEIVAPSDMTVNIAGSPESHSTKHVVIANTVNPQKLEIVADAWPGKLKSKDNILYLVAGKLTIKGPKDSKLEHEQRSRIELQDLPKPVRMEDPDMVRLVDCDRTFHQTGSVRINVPTGAKIILT